MNDVSLVEVFLSTFLPSIELLACYLLNYRLYLTEKLGQGS